MGDQGKRLKAARLKAGYLSAREAALALGWVVSTYTAHENGQNGLNSRSAARYAQAFKTTPEWLLFGKGPGNEARATLEQQLAELPPDVARELLTEFNSMIAGVKLALKMK